MSGYVKYQVERRPITPGGKVIRGSQPGDYVAILTNPENVVPATGILNQPVDLASSSGVQAKYIPVGFTGPIPPLSTGSSAGAKSHVVEVIGECWLVASTHFSVESATDAAASLANAIGAENVRIVKVITGRTEFKI
ncbi:hypothetical protein ACK8P5_25730 (plasmid) [Paenibacillus sp. EC2-1]|uniref:hypothetical protein n=1 Tax=Paenibacillus sp. EC2-1 TaxID=3388665 RepID=UPI003BEEE95B